MIVDRKPRRDVPWFASLWTGVDRATLTAETLAAMKRSSAPASERETTLDPLERRWYDSIVRGEPDYAVYDDPAYIPSVWTSWSHYSRGYIIALRKMRANGGLPGIRTIADLGCGFGLSTLALAEVFPDAKVFGTNLPGRQTDVARYLGVEVVDALDRPVDLVFASEYMEHIERPLEHIDEIVRVGRPRYIVSANAFGAVATGHFRQFKDGERTINGSAMGRAWGIRLRSLGYQRVETGFWNNRPQVWERPVDEWAL